MAVGRSSYLDGIHPQPCRAAMVLPADAEGRLLNVNPACAAALGWSETDVVGNTSEWLITHSIARKAVPNSLG